jgi:hypothetical protein
MSPIRVALLAGIAAAAMTGPAAASLATSTHARLVQPTLVQYAQDFSHGMRESNAYKSTTKKSKHTKSKKTGTTGQAKSTNTNPSK